MERHMCSWIERPGTGLLKISILFKFSNTFAAIPSKPRKTCFFFHRQVDLKSLIVRHMNYNSQNKKKWNRRRKLGYLCYPLIRFSLML